MATRKARPRSKTRTRTATTEERPSGPIVPLGERELIVVANPEAGLRASREGVSSAAGADVAPIADLLRSEGVTLRPLFGLSEERLIERTTAMAASAAAVGAEGVPDLSVYYRVEAADERLDELAEQLRESEAVTAAYVKPPGELPQMLNDMAPSPEDAPPVTPDFTARQIYLDAAPSGIDARYAWTLSGGSGAGIRIIDLEWAWRFDHEDLTQNQGGVVGGTQSANLRSRNHGTAVIGEIGGDRNNRGITGICPDATVSAVAFSMPSAAAIRLAADRLRAGDIMLLEIHRAGPRHNFQGREDQLGYIAIEWWPDDFDAIRYAIGRGVIVVEAAGNGAENLDDPLYNVRPPGFPPTWTNPFNRANRDSGAIVVGAGAPPPGTHGRDWGPDRSRLDFSNFGALIDAQGWGREVTSTGYGDLQGGMNENEWYTDRFSGTSSASPIVVGALGCVQGILRARGKPLLTPARARQCLRSTGSPQQNAPGRPITQRIGNRPNLRQLINCADPKIIKEVVKEKGEKIEIKDAKREKAEIKEKNEKIEIKELKREKIEKIEIKEKREKSEFEVIRPFERIQPTQAAGGGALEERLARLEAAVAQLTHFISPELRPDLSAGALTYEPDVSGADVTALSQELEKQAADAKQAKDNKDVEKLGEY